MEDYKTVRGVSSGEIEEKHSRFIAQLAFADTEEKALAFLEKVRAENRTARHNVYAYMLRQDNRVRYSDDGEPAKTAGMPVLDVLKHAGITDCVMVVTRYFGGILLGTGGLVRAYSGAAALAVQNAEIVTVRSCVRVTATVEYSLYDRVMQLFKAKGADTEEPIFGADITITALMAEGTETSLAEDLTALSRGKSELSVSKPFYASLKI